MIVDLEKPTSVGTTKTEFNVVVVGAGAAGITLANRLASKGRKVALVEGGGYEFTPQSQKVYKGTTHGDPYFSLDQCRMRHFGGTTNAWAGWCRTFDEIDFDRSHHGPEYAWPISKSDLDPFLQMPAKFWKFPTHFKIARFLKAMSLRYSLIFRLQLDFEKNIFRL